MHKNKENLNLDLTADISLLLNFNNSCMLYDDGWMQ